MHALLAAALLFATLGNADIVKLVKAGLSPETIEAKIASSETNFDTSTDALVTLANEGVPDRVIRAMVERKPSQKTGRLKPAAPQRRYEATVHVDGGGKCEGELRVDSKGVKFSRCRKNDFEIAWPSVKNVCYEYGFRGVVVIDGHRVSVTTPAEAKKIVEHIRGVAAAVPIAACE